jgi:hypothetical protein
MGGKAEHDEVRCHGLLDQQFLVYHFERAMRAKNPYDEAVEFATS